LIKFEQDKTSMSEIRSSHGKTDLTASMLLCISHISRKLLEWNAQRYIEFKWSKEKVIR